MLFYTDRQNTPAELTTAWSLIVGKFQETLLIEHLWLRSVMRPMCRPSSPAVLAVYQAATPFVWRLL